ncbi:MAG: sulfotransferase [Phycisphaerae bacterium]|nr:sulfotransferase [Phycisphaerae bacterium]
MNFRPLLVTGMFRSGTTLLARMLNAHPDIALASDPFLPFLKYLRTVVARDVLGPAAPAPLDPLGDYFADYDGLRLLRAVQTANLDWPLSETDRAMLWPALQSFAKPFSPKLAERLDEVRGTTLRELYVDMLRLTQDVYGTGREQYVGHKEAWADEFGPALHRALPHLKSIHVIRDPRAVCASKNVADDKYPWLFLIRQWRKLTGLAWLAAYASAAREDCLLLRYEDLVADPPGASRRICAFLGLEFAPAMADAQSLKDGADTPWQRNSSYGDLATERSISSKGADRWRRVLSPREIELIEQLTYPVMQMFGYQPLTTPTTKLNAGLRFCPPQVTTEQLTPWIRTHVRVDPVSTVVQMAEEGLRLQLLHATPDVPDDVVEALFLGRPLYEACRDFVRTTEGATV